ncbi:SapC family protein [Marinobacter sp. CA1]|uniref:SapC family protein n=1 Tax=Marinobacter sp. CA1 TaxID=2817656 RepID=UPI001D082D41|nr:SapC family protein [Marinobacter sp. CA1]UDL03829.1 SapC family protein [Marinobacter sp. CA1]
MSEWVAVSRSLHGDMAHVPRKGFYHTERSAVSVALLSELAAMLPHYVIGFLALEDAVFPVAILGIENNQNLYLNSDGRWLASYVPAEFRSHPFALIDDGMGRKVLAIDRGHLSTEGEPLFEEGVLSAKVSDVVTFLTHCDSDRQATGNACQALQQAGVLTDWVLDVPVGGVCRQVRGLKRIDERALNALDESAFAALRGAPIQIAYAQLFSMSQVKQLSQRASLPMNAVNEKRFSLDDLFGEEDGNLSFDS